MQETLNWFSGHVKNQRIFNMNKRGQIALFVIIAILVIGAVSVFILFQTNVIKAPVSAEAAQKIVAAQTGPVRDHIEGCMKIVVMKSLNTLGRQGGYIIPKAGRYSIPYTVSADAPTITYALFYDKSRDGYENFFPSIAEMKEEFASFMQNNPDFLTCIDNFNQFKNLVDVKAGELKINNSGIDFGEKSGKIIVPFSYQLEISKQDSKTIIDDYKVEIPINLDKIHENAAVILNEVSAGKSAIVIMQNQAKMQEQALRDDPETDRIFISSRAYDDIETASSGEIYNSKNTMYIINYENPSLAEPFSFSFLVGEK